MDIPLSNESVTQVDESVMNSEAARRLTFYNWPHKDCSRYFIIYIYNYYFSIPGAQQLSESGFYHWPNDLEDRVRCFYCGITLVSWEKDDDP